MKTETNIHPIDHIHEAVTFNALLYCNHIRELIERQCLEIIETGANFTDYDVRVSEIQSELKRLNDEKEMMKIKTTKLESEMRKIEKSIRIERRRLGDDFDETKIQSAIQRYSELYDEYVGLKKPRYGRLGHDTIVHYMFTLERKLSSLMEAYRAKRKAVIHMKENMKRFVSIYRKASEVDEIAFVIRNVMIGMTRGGYERAGQANREAYFFSTLDQLKPSDLDFHPFDNIRPDDPCVSETHYDMDRLETDVVRKCFYELLKCRVMKFAKYNMMRMFDDTLLLDGSDRAIQQSELVY